MNSPAKLTVSKIPDNRPHDRDSSGPILNRIQSVRRIVASRHVVLCLIPEVNAIELYTLILVVSFRHIDLTSNEDEYT